MMHRNLDRRVEALVRVVAPAHLSQIEDLFDQAMDERTASWWLQPDGVWERHSEAPDGSHLADLQERNMARVVRRRRTRVAR
jgi:polyphosphate kinase